MPTLGRYGQNVCNASDLKSAIGLANELMGPLLQTQTRVVLRIDGDTARWTYTVTDASDIGRQKNEILAIGYMLDLLRRFLGSTWTPERAVVSGGFMADRTITSTTLDCDFSLGAQAFVEFPSACLDALNPAGPVSKGTDTDIDVPERNDLIFCTEQLIDLAMLDGRPSIDWLCRRLHMSRRSFQRRLRQDGLTFEDILRTRLSQKAQHLLSQKRMTTSEVAQALGYSDQAHFSRAFKSWTGVSPCMWRMQ